MQRYGYSCNPPYFCLFFCMKITFFLLLSPKCVRTQTVVYGLQHFFRIDFCMISMVWRTTWWHAADCRQKTALKNESTCDGWWKYSQLPTKVLAMPNASTFVFWGRFAKKDSIKRKSPVPKGHRAKELLFLNPFSVFIASFEYNLKFQHRVGRNGRTTALLRTIAEVVGHGDHPVIANVPHLHKGSDETIHQVFG